MNLLKSTVFAIMLSGSAIALATPSSGPAATGSDRDAGYRIICTSDNSPLTYCDWDQSQGRPKLLRQLSRHPCIRNSSWGYDNRGLWVRSGCVGEFAPG